MSNNIKEVIAKTSEAANNILGALSPVLSVFFPKVKAGAVLAGSVLEKLSEIDDKKAQSEVLGLTATAEALDNYLKQVETGKEPNKDEVIKLLEQASAGILAVLLDEGIDFFALQVGKDLDVAFGFFIAHIEPELIERIGCGAVAIKPNIALLRFAKLLTVGFRDEGAGEGEGFVVAAKLAADEFRSGGDVAPLVGAPHLEFAALLLVEVEEVVALEQLIGKFGKRHTFGKFAVETALHAVLRHHIIDGDALSDFACKVEEGIVFHPVVIVDEFGGIGSIAFKVEKARQLGFDASHVVAQRFFVEEVAFGAFPRWVANHTGSTADEGEGLMSRLLKVAKHHDTAKVPDVEGVGRGIDAHGGGNLLFVKQFFRSRHHLMEHTAPFKFFYEIHRLYFVFEWL